MRKKTLTVRTNRDGTVTIRSERYVEHVDTRGKLPWEKYEIVKWAIVTAGFSFTGEIEEIVRDEIGDVKGQILVKSRSNLKRVLKRWLWRGEKGV